jgi:hypothetical protein
VGVTEGIKGKSETLILVVALYTVINTDTCNSRNNSPRLRKPIGDFIDLLDWEFVFPRKVAIAMSIET